MTPAFQLGCCILGQVRIGDADGNENAVILTVGNEIAVGNKIRVKVTVCNTDEYKVSHSDPDAIPDTDSEPYRNHVCVHTSFSVIAACVLDDVDTQPWANDPVYPLSTDHYRALDDVGPTP